jgi:ATPase family associated with various cellular activities (AAA)
MKNSPVTIASADALNLELDWLGSVIYSRISSLKNGDAVELPAPPNLQFEESHYAKFVNEHNLTALERLVLILGCSLYLRPEILHPLGQDNDIRRLSMTDAGQQKLALSPTIETALFLAAHTNLQERVQAIQFFEPGHLFYRLSVFDMGASEPGESVFAASYQTAAAWRDLFLYGTWRAPRFSPHFPAHLIETTLGWDDLIVMLSTSDKIAEARESILAMPALRQDWKLGGIIPEGFRLLLHGDSGQGKTLTASLFGQLLKRPVYRIDVSAVASKWIGETMQRLDALFRTAENKDWILFFDEGDALLQQRSTEGGSESSRYSNMDAAFLLQRIESFNGIIIVATNLMQNIDRGFVRRFQSIIPFKPLDSEHQTLVWQRFWPHEQLAFPQLNNAVNLYLNYPLSPAAICNVIRRAATYSVTQKINAFPAELFERFVKDENLKFKSSNMPGFGR